MQIIENNSSFPTFPSHFFLFFLQETSSKTISLVKTGTAAFSQSSCRTDNVKLYSIGWIIAECAIRLRAQRLLRLPTKVSPPKTKEESSKDFDFARHWQPVFIYTFKGLMYIALNETIVFICIHTRLTVANRVVMLMPFRIVVLNAWTDGSHFKQDCCARFSEI